MIIALIIAHAYPPNSGLGGDVHFDEDENWNFKGDDASGSMDFFSVALHEIGHALGLGHSDTREAVMYSLFSKQLYQLHEDDKRRIQSMYGVRKIKQRNPVRRTTRRTTIQTTKRRTKPTYRPQYLDHRLLPMKPKKCSIQFDAISFIRGQIFIFKDQYMWFFSHGSTVSEEPYEIDNMWPGLPKSVTKIDAFYENTKQRQFWMFVGNMIYVFGQPRNQIEIISTWSISSLGLPTYVHKIDAIFTWGSDGRTYIFAGDKYWR